MIAGKDAVRMGEAKNSWLTGTAAWNFVAITQWILGIKPGFDPMHVCNGVATITVDGKHHAGATLPVFEADTDTVVVTLD